MERIHGNSASQSHITFNNRNDQMLPASLKEQIQQKLDPYSLVNFKVQLQNALEKNPNFKVLYSYFQVAAELASKGPEAETDLSDLAYLARSYQLDLAKCGPYFNIAESQKTTDSFQLASTTSSTVRLIPHLSKSVAQNHLHQIMEQHSKGMSLADAFYKVDGGGAKSLSALGQLNNSDVHDTLTNHTFNNFSGNGLIQPNQTERKLKEITFRSMCHQVANQVKKTTRAALEEVKILEQYPQARKNYLSSFKTASERYQNLRSLGFEHQIAYQIARNPKRNDVAFGQGLKQASRALDDLYTFASKSEIFEEVALSMFENFQPVVQEQRNKFVIRQDSFADRAIREGLARGQRIEKLNQQAKEGANLLSYIINPNVTAGAGALVKIASSAIKYGVFNGSDKLIVNHQLRRMDIAEGMGLAAQGTKQKVKEKIEAQQKNKLWMKLTQSKALKNSQGMVQKNYSGSHLQ